MICFLIIWYLIGVFAIWFIEWKRGNVKRLKNLIDWFYAIGVSLGSWLTILYALINYEKFF